MNSAKVYQDEIPLIRPEGNYKAQICICYFPLFSHYQDRVVFLHPQERKYYNTLKYEKRIKSYLIGRYAAKKAVSNFTQVEDLTTILIQPGIFTQPIVLYESKLKQTIQVSITHCDDFGAALAFPEAHPMGIDLERIDSSRQAAIEREITEAERERIQSLPLSYEAALTLLWTAKEALSKVLKTGLMTPFKVFELQKIEYHPKFTISYYTNFAQYKTISFTIGDYMCSIVYPLKTEMTIDIQGLQNTFLNIETHRLVSGESE